MKLILYPLVMLAMIKMKVYGEFWARMYNREDIKSTEVLYNLTSDIIKDCDERIAKLESIRLDTFRTASYEIGFTNYMIMEEYRKMVDKYNTSKTMWRNLYPMETVLYLMEIEAHYWQIGHLVSMQHEIERKYRIVSGLHGRPEEMELTLSTLDPAFVTKARKTKDRETKLLATMLAILEGTTKKKSTRWWWPLEYGWEIEKFW